MIARHAVVVDLRGDANEAGLAVPGRVPGGAQRGSGPIEFTLARMAALRACE